MIEYRAKDEKERFVFEAFRKVCPLGITRFEPRPKPEPDILAYLATNEQIAFEVTQVDDENYQRLEKTAYELDKLLAAAREGLVDHRRWRGCIIKVTFPEEIKYGARRKYVPDVIKRLNATEPGQPLLPIRDKTGKRVCFLEAAKLDLDTDVYISTSTFSVVGDYTLEGVSKKLDKSYETPYPIHLLAWSVKTWLPEVWDSALTMLFRQQAIFERIWVYGYASNEIVFDSGTLATA